YLTPSALSCIKICASLCGGGIKSSVDRRKEVTNPLKVVCKDIWIATYLKQPLGAICSGEIDERRSGREELWEEVAVEDSLILNAVMTCENGTKNKMRARTPLQAYFTKTQGQLFICAFSLGDIKFGNEDTSPLKPSFVVPSPTPPNLSSSSSKPVSPPPPPSSPHTDTYLSC
ncbi:hypothetical protein GYMLUDRAFT_906700, partial [Collybiopsis luxurians FD-317 M1]